MSANTTLTEPEQVEFCSLVNEIRAALDINSQFFNSMRIYPPEIDDVSKSAPCKNLLYNIAQNVIDAHARIGNPTIKRVSQLGVQFNYANIEECLDSDPEEREFMRLAKVLDELFLFAERVRRKNEAPSAV